MSTALLDAAADPDPATPPASRTLHAIGTTAIVVVTDEGAADVAAQLLADDLARLDVACSRFREDSELRRVERTSRGRPVAVSPLLYEALEVACAVAVRTAGTVDPTVGSAVASLGYDRDFDAVRTAPDASGTHAAPGATPGWWQLTLDPEARTLAVPEGVRIDLGSTAKALAADRSAERIATLVGCGVLVNLGGDVSVAGHGPAAGWSVGIAPRSDAATSDVDEIVPLADGGLATSGTTARSWTHRGRAVHHIVDPWTGDSAPAVWTLASAVAPTCVEANAWTTAAIVWGDDAPGNLAARGVRARLVAADGTVVTVGAWPGVPVGAGSGGARS